jgi:hypothetical protein
VCAQSVSLNRRRWRMGGRVFGAFKRKGRFGPMIIEILIWEEELR